MAKTIKPGWCVVQSASPCQFGTNSSSSSSLDKPDSVSRVCRPALIFSWIVRRLRNYLVIKLLLYNIVRHSKKGHSQKWADAQAFHPSMTFNFHYNHFIREKLKTKKGRKKSLTWDLWVEMSHLCLHKLFWWTFTFLSLSLWISLLLAFSKQS